MIQSYLVLNGQRIPIENEGEVQLNLIDEAEDSFIELNCGAINIKWNISLIFILRNTTVDKEGRHFLLALHDFNCLKLTYSGENTALLIDAFISSVHGKMREMNQQQEKNTEYNELQEGKRLKVAEECLLRVISNHEKLISISKICPTYAELFIVPSDITSSMLRHAAKYRAKGRLPIISWIHPTTRAILSRSSQALAGLKGAHNPQDVRLVSAIKSFTQTDTLVVVDARAKSSALANSMTGGGEMPLERYEKCTRVYLGIENIHHVRKCYLSTFSKMIHQERAMRSAKVEAGWTSLYSKIMEGVSLIIGHLQSGHSVLVHCSDGWDRTAQLVSLSQICLDPNCRTIGGFLQLITSEWILSGHQFEKRLARFLPINTFSIPTDSTSSSNSNGSKFMDAMLSGISKGTKGIDEGVEPKEEFCPIFPQFLDCLIQLIRVYPSYFEFTADLPRYLWILSFDSQKYFYGNCDFDRRNSSYFLTDLVDYCRRFTNGSFRGNEQEENVEKVLEITKDVMFYL